MFDIWQQKNILLTKLPLTPKFFDQTENLGILEKLVFLQDNISEFLAIHLCLSMSVLVFNLICCFPISTNFICLEKDIK